MISRVETEIDAYDDLPGAAVDNVQGLLGEIAQRLEHPREDNQDQALIDGLKEAIEQYEATHPKVTVLLSNSMNTLASMGI